MEVQIDVVDSIFVNSPFTSDSTSNNPSDTIVIGNNTTLTRDSTYPTQDSTIVDDTLIIADSPEIEYKKLFSIKSKSYKSMQGLAIYGNELFNFHDSNNFIDVYNMKTYQPIASIELRAESAVHCNTVSFSSEFYQMGDKYPLIYVQHNGNYNKVNVYRIILQDTVYSAQKIQTISFSPCSHSLTAIDRENKKMYIFYLNNNERFIALSDIPKTSPQKFSFNLSKVQKTYAISIPKVVQDTAFDKDCLYLICGYNKQGELWRIDMKSKTARIIDLTKYGMTSEPEGLDIYEGNVIVSFQDKSVYQIRINN